MADVTMYDSPNFGGQNVTLGVGNHALADTGSFNDLASSLRVPAGTVALLYEDADAGGGYGRSVDLLEDCADLAQFGLNHAVSFVSVFDAETPTGFVWARNSMVNGQFVAGHWERKRASGAPVNSSTAVVSPALPPHGAGNPGVVDLSGVAGPVIRDHRGPAGLDPGTPGLPHLLELSKIDGTPWTNPTFDTSDPNWPSNVVGGATFDGSSAHPLEWVSVLNPTIEQDDEVGVSGVAVGPEQSGADLPFTHPFGPDFEFTIVPDAPYESLLAPANRDPNGVYRSSWADATALGLPAPVGVLGLEVDGDLVPESYRVQAGDRVAVYGRCIVDAGHPEFHTEIHPPLLMARAHTVDASGNPAPRSGATTTFFQLWSRPYQAGQRFSTGGDTGLALKDYASNIAETTGDIQAFPPIFPKSFAGVHLVSFTVRPPVPRRTGAGAIALEQLECSYHFTVNGACGVQVVRSPADPDSVLVMLALNSVGYPTLPEPASHYDTYSIQSLLSQAPSSVDLSWLESTWLDYKGTVYVRRFATPAMPTAETSADVVPFTTLDALPASTHASDPTQPFPVVGWVKVQWVATGRVQATRLNIAT